MWLDDEALADHFEGVKRRLQSGSGSSDIESAGDSQNELTRDLRKR